MPMKKITSPLLFVFIISISFGQIKTEQFVYPAEFEKIDAIWFGWGITTYTDTATKENVENIRLNIIAALIPHVQVRLIVSDTAQRNYVIAKLLKRSVDTSKISYFLSPNWHFWLRDYGPIFLRSNKRRLMGVDFGFNCYGNCRESIAAIANKGDSTIAASMGLKVIKSNIISEGGDREFNGKGVMITNEAVELQRNPSITKEQIEAEFKRVLHVKKVIWLKYPMIDDVQSRAGLLPTGVYSAGGTGGHVDELCHFADEHTLLVARMNEEEKNKDSLSLLDYQYLKANYTILKNATDQNGEPFKIIEMPVPDFISAKHFINDNAEAFHYPGTIPGDTIRFLAAASYINFVIANDVVLMPKYWKEGLSFPQKQKDDEALKIMQHAFPGRKIIQLDVTEFNFGGGGMHCLTQQQPSLN